MADVKPMACPQCDGCGKIANDDDGTPWSAWEQLPESAKGAIRAGLVFPLRCPMCEGTGNPPKVPA